MSQGYLTLVGAPPSPIKMEWRQWHYELLRRRIAEVSVARTGPTYYCDSTRPDDSGDGLSPSTAKKNVSAIQTLVAASSGQVRALFKRGLEYPTTTGLVGAKDYLTFGSYGTGYAKPLLHCFTNTVAAGAGGWTASSGAHYRSGITNAVGWIRQKTSDFTRLSPYRHMNSVAGCQATTRSWFWDTSTSRLYVNVDGGTTSPDAYAWEWSDQTAANNNGLELDGDNILVQGLRFDGWGAAAGQSYQKWGIMCTVSGGQDLVVVMDCESYYAGRHNMGHLSNVAGSRTYWVRCRSGYQVAQNAGVGLDSNTYVAYANSGAPGEFVLEQCVSRFGQLPYTTYAGPFHGLNSASFHMHSAGGTADLVILNQCGDLYERSYPNATHSSGNPYFQASILPGTDSDLSSCRAFVMDYRAADDCAGQIDLSERTFYGNCRWNLRFTSATAETSLYAGTSVSGGWLVNGRINIVDERSNTNVNFLTNSSSNTTKIWHTQIRYNGTASDAINYRLFLCGAANGTTSVRVVNSLLERIGTAGFFSGLGNNSTYHQNIARFQMQEAGSNGVDQALASLLLDDYWEDEAQPIGTPWAEAGQPLGLEYDANWNRRPVIGPSIGPFEARPQMIGIEAAVQDLRDSVGDWSHETNGNIRGALRAIANAFAAFACPDLIADDGAGPGEYDPETHSLQNVGAIMNLAIVAENLLAAQAGSSASQIVGPSSMVNNNLSYIGQRIVMLSGAAAGDERTIVNYVGSTRTLTPDRNFRAAIATNDFFVVLRGAPVKFSSDAESKLTAALTALRLDQLLAAQLTPQPVSNSLFGMLTEDDGGQQRYRQNALEQAPAGGGGGGADPLLNDVPGTYSAGTAGWALGRLRAANITTVSPVSQDGQTLTLVRGDDYQLSEGTQLIWQTTDASQWPTLTGATITLTIKGTVTLSVAGNIVTATGANKAVNAQLTRAQTATLTESEYDFDVQATFANLNKKILVRGKVKVLDRYAP